MKSFFKNLIFIFGLFFFSLSAENIPQDISYSKIYDFIDELANDGYIEINSSIKPYSRTYIANKLTEAKSQEQKLTTRQKKELNFFFNDFSLEIQKLPHHYWNLRQTKHSDISLLSPSFSYLDSSFSCQILPLMGAAFFANKNDFMAKRWVGASFQSYIGKNLSIYASLRDFAHMGEILAQPTYLNLYEGGAYKVNGEYSEMRGGITYHLRWASVALVKDKIVWGNNYHGSNIFSGRNPSFPMIQFALKPAKWIELNYIHGWLVSNVVDSTRYYIENNGTENGLKKYRMTNKYVAANMLTLTPIKKLNISVGNSIVYAEDNIQPAYLIPLMFYKSVDHTLAATVENQNSQLFFDISSRNINHLHMYSSIYIDELSFVRFKPENKETNPISYKVGAKLNNWPFNNISFIGEYTRNNIICYKHSIPALAWSSNDYNLGHYLGDNSEEIYLSVNYKPIRGFELSISYINAKHGNEYQYIRRDQYGINRIRPIISQDFMQDIVWTNQTYAFDIVYEMFNNIYAGFNIQYSDIQSNTPSSFQLIGEDRYDAQGYLDVYTPKAFQGKNITVGMSLSLGF